MTDAELDTELIRDLRRGWAGTQRAADRIEALIAERDYLKHDIERHIQIAADLATECEERYRAGIEAAAKVCEAWRAGCDNRSMQAEGWASAECAIAIRALLSETAGESPAPPQP